MLKEEVLLINEELEGERLDACIAEQFEYLSRSMVQTLLADGQITIDGKIHKASYRVKEGEEIRVRIPAPQEVNITAQDIPLEIVYQDKDIVIINKPQGMVVHPAHGNWDNTLVNALLFHIKDLSGINGELRPGIVHRLDKDTSGLLMVAKNDQSHRHLAQQIKEHSFNREYFALVHGNISEKLGVIEAPIGRSKTDRKKMAVDKDGKPAISEYQVLERFRNYTLVKVKLLTGRTHQIRVHFAYINHPVVGDPLYGPAKKHFDLNGQALHACLLGFIHPSTGQYMEFTADLPVHMQKIIEQLEK
ncbi:MAG TPA: RluA family pseudouridine synthase [Syntrophomonadaceae bacterium]|jgi:23S rRNA pseudouridine1911/1915/1917 synthase|nr:RluA family pseudouridine synthase [Syntrophomonadaceae bacterium]HRX21741.1 RluA family pseudouridine synthase [Syntrophomonadaceae bacterium]